MTRYRVVLMHYSPVRATVVGESPEIYAFLGSSRLEEPLSRFEVTAVFHGHAHRGTLYGTTSKGIPVYNVSLELLKQQRPDQPPFHVLEVRSSDALPTDPGISERRRGGRRSND